MDTILDRALALAAQGLPVFPCNADKTPALRRGFLAASGDPEQVRRFWWDGRLIGVPTGTRSGLAVLDIDVRHGGEEFALANADRLRTVTHLTRSGGLHLLFRYREGLRNSAGLIAPGVDVRGEGGYIIWWPAHGCDVLNDGPIEEWPEWIALPARDVPIRRDKPGRVIGDRFQTRVLANFVRESRQGQRNARLFWAACRLAEMDFMRPEYQQRAISRLLDAAVATGLSVEEAHRTIASGLSRE